jgi:hypothetical protein
MKAIFIRFLMVLMFAGVVLSPLKGVSFAGAPLPPAMADTDLAATAAQVPADNGFVLVPSAVPCLVAIAITAFHYENGSSGRAEAVPVPAGRLTGIDVNPSHGPPISS